MCYVNDNNDFSRWPFRRVDAVDSVDTTPDLNLDIITNNNYNFNKTEPQPDLHESLQYWLSPQFHNVVIVILVLVLVAKFFYDDEGEITKQLRFKEDMKPEKEDARDIATNTDMMNSAALDVSLRQKFGATLAAMHTPIFPLSGMSDGWVEVGEDTDVGYCDKECQTDERHSEEPDSSSNDDAAREPKILRSIDECLVIYKSEVIKFNFFFIFVLYY